MKSITHIRLQNLCNFLLIGGMNKKGESEHDPCRERPVLQKGGAAVVFPIITILKQDQDILTVNCVHSFV